MKNKTLFKPTLGSILHVRGPELWYGLFNVVNEPSKWEAAVVINTFDDNSHRFEVVKFVPDETSDSSDKATVKKELMYCSEQFCETTGNNKAWKLWIGSLTVYPPENGTKFNDIPPLVCREYTPEEKVENKLAFNKLMDIKNA